MSRLLTAARAGLLAWSTAEREPQLTLTVDTTLELLASRVPSAAPIADAAVEAFHEFAIAGRRYREPHDEDDSPDIVNERTVTLRHVAPGERGQFSYLYDFGDGWDHSGQLGCGFYGSFFDRCNGSHVFSVSSKNCYFRTAIPNANRGV